MSAKSISQEIGGVFPLLSTPYAEDGLLDCAIRRVKGRPVIRKDMNASDYFKINASLGLEVRSVAHSALFFKQVIWKWIDEALFKSGVMHNDAHTGNIMIDNRNNEKRATFIDFGNIVKLTEKERELLLKMVTAVASKHKSFFVDTFIELMFGAEASDEKKAFKKSDLKKKPDAVVASVIDKGLTAPDTGYRFQALLSEISKLGIDIPPQIATFVEGLTRLQNCHEELCDLLAETESLHREYQLQVVCGEGIGVERDEFDAVGKLLDLMLDITVDKDRKVPGPYRDAYERVRQMAGFSEGFKPQGWLVDEMKKAFEEERDSARNTKAEKLASKGWAILADEMGLGKTVQAIAAALLMKEVAQVRRVLVVVPTSLKGEWADQIELFSDVVTELLVGDRRERLARYRETDAFFVVANYEQILRDWKEVNEILGPDLVILDEAQRIKNWQTKTARTLKRLASRFAFVLTGTPLENRIDEFYSIAEFVAPGLFGSLFRFNRHYYKFDERGKSTGMQNLGDLHEKATTIMLRRRKDMVEDELPGRTDKNYFVALSDEQAARYGEFEMKVTRLCGQAQKRPLTKEELDRLQRYLASMRMLCDSCYILDQKIRESPKADEAISVLEDVFASDPGRKVVVFSEWVRMLELVEERLRDAGIGFAVHTGSVRQDRRRAELMRFRTDPDCRVLLSSESGGVGLNLQSASVVMNLDLPWNPPKLEQRIARAWRKRQSRDVLVVNLVAEGTIEHKMLSTLKFKQGLADLVLDARGDTADFESEKSKNAFLARVSSLMESQLPSVVRASGTEGEDLVAAAPKTDPSETGAGMSEPPSVSADDLLTPDALTLQFAVQGLPVPDAPRRVRAFLAACTAS